MDVVLGAVACVATWALFLPFARIIIDPHHDGVVLKPALDVLHGQTLFRDSFCQYGVLTPYLDALALAVAGPRLEVLRVMTVLVYALAAGVLVVCWRFVVPRGLALFALAFWIVRAPFLSASTLYAWSSVPALLFQATALLALLVALARARTRPAVVAGVAGALAFLARQPVGALTLLAVGIAWLPALGSAHGRRGLAGSIVGALAVVVPFGVWLAWSGAARPWLEQTVLWPRQWIESGVGTTEALLPFPAAAMTVFAVVVAALAAFRVVPSRFHVAYAIAAGASIAIVSRQLLWIAGTTGAFVVALVASAALGAARHFRTRTPESHVLVAGLVVSVAAWLQMYPRADAHHTFWALAPATGFVVHAAWEAAGRRTLALVVLGAAMYGLAEHSIGGAYVRLTAPWETLVQPTVLAGMREDAAQAAGWRRLAAVVGTYVAAHPGAPLIVEGRDGLYATLVPDAGNPGPFFIYWPGLESVGVDERVQAIASKRPLVFRQGRARAPVQRALDDAHYVVVLSLRAGDLLASRDPH